MNVNEVILKLRAFCALTGRAGLMAIMSFYIITQSIGLIHVTEYGEHHLDHHHGHHHQSHAEFHSGYDGSFVDFHHGATVLKNHQDNDGDSKDEDSSCGWCVYATQINPILPMALTHITPRTPYELKSKTAFITARKAKLDNPHPPAHAPPFV